MPRKKPLVIDNEQYSIARGFGVNEFGKLIESVLIREAKDIKKDRFSPSGFGYSGTCPRYYYYRLNGAFAEYNTSPEAVTNMDAGTDAGVRLAKVLEDAGILVDKEVLVENVDPPIGGYIDAIVNWKGEEVVCEIKTTRDNTFNYRVMNNKVPGYQMIQLLIYMKLTNHDKGFFLTENKDSGKIFILPIKMNDAHRELIDYVFDWMRKVKAAADAQQLPTRSYDKATIQCRGCEFKNTCWEGYYKGSKNKPFSDPNPGVVDLPKLEVPK